MIKDLSSSLSSTFLDVLASLGSILESDSVNNVFEALVVNIGSQHSYSTFVFHLNSHHVLTQTIVWMDTWTAIKALVVLKINCHLNCATTQICVLVLCGLSDDHYKLVRTGTIYL